ncbi:hypothetical protein cyc_01487 [Cyclospora cayetanensis]|uniref:Uncharacterized protein n=1 Tax=Cyclospora cayetanensis TaxID=88456 RepID=A0A1D3D6V2_9EIME|nr:hypothetical protein cyc_01487 [Cyclospora cayetanensis]
MSRSSSRRLSLGTLSSRGSVNSFQVAGLEFNRNKQGELAQAMLSEVDEILRAYDAELGAVLPKAQCSRRRSLSDDRFPNAQANASSSLDITFGRSESRRHWGLCQSDIFRMQTSAAQPASTDLQVDGDAINTLLAKVHTLLSTQMAPKIQELMTEVAELRRHNELLSEKLEQQRQRNEKQASALEAFLTFGANGNSSFSHDLEEFEELQSELRAHEAQQKKQKSFLKELDICQSENAMLKVELKNLHVLIAKHRDRKSAQSPRQAHQEDATDYQKASSNEWLRKENEDLRHEVSRRRVEMAEKETTINQLMDAIRSLSCTESRKWSMQRRKSSVQCLPDSPRSPQSLASSISPGVVSLDSQVGEALCLEGPRERSRSNILDRVGFAAPSVMSGSVTTLAEDLSLASTPASDSSSGPPVALILPAEKRSSLRGAVQPSTLRLAVKKTNLAPKHIQLKEASGLASEGSELQQQLSNALEAMERALFELEDLRSSQLKETAKLKTDMDFSKQAFIQAKEQIRTMTEEAERLRNECQAARAEQREAQTKLDESTRQLRESCKKVGELQDTLERMHNAKEEAQRAANDTSLRLTNALQSAEGQAVIFRDKISNLEGMLTSLRPKQGSSGTLEPAIYQVTPREAFDIQDDTRDVSKLGSGTANLCLLQVGQASASRPSACPVQTSCSSGQLQLLEAPVHAEELSIISQVPNVGCCSPFGCLNIWIKDVLGHKSLKALQTKPPNDVQAASWSSQKLFLDGEIMRRN